MPNHPSLSFPSFRFFLCNLSTTHSLIRLPVSRATSQFINCLISSVFRKEKIKSVRSRKSREGTSFFLRSFQSSRVKPTTNERQCLRTTLRRIRTLEWVPYAKPLGKNNNRPHFLCVTIVRPISRFFHAVCCCTTGVLYKYTLHQ